MQDWAAVDLGSNSFHLLRARPGAAGLEVVERRRHKVQLIRGLGPAGLDPDARQRGLACLRDFARQLEGVPPSRRRVVGTQALRAALDADDFVAEAAALLQAPVRILRGEEEAGLIALAVLASRPPAPGPRLVIDIGGGSTELAFVDGDALALHSHAVGCVSLMGTLDGLDRTGLWPRCRQRARAALGELALPAMAAPPAQVFGCSGTLEATREVLAAVYGGGPEICRDAVDRLDGDLTAGRWSTTAALPALVAERREIFLPGFALVWALFDRFALERLETVPVALQDGVLLAAWRERQLVDLPGLPGAR